MDGVTVVRVLELGGGASVAALSGLFAWRTRTLTGVGAACMALIGLSIVTLGGWLWLVPIVAFFSTSVLLGRIPSGEFEKPETRTAWQVMANGGVAWFAILMLLFEDTDFWDRTDSLIIYFGAVTAATADTWATEIGVRIGGTPRDMVSGRALAIGVSGGISAAGTVGAGAGALLIAVLLPLLKPSYSGDWISVGSIALAGWIGAMSDSFLGSLAQRRYRCRVCGENTEEPEHCGTRTSLRSGFLTSNQVNWFCTFLGGVTTWIWLRW